MFIKLTLLREGNITTELTRMAEAGLPNENFRYVYMRNNVICVIEAMYSHQEILHSSVLFGNSTYKVLESPEFIINKINEANNSIPSNMRRIS